MILASMYSEQTRQRYRTLARQAVADQDHDRAKFFFSRLVGTSGAIDPKDEYQWALLAARSGDFVTAQELIDQLAPDNGTGYSEAHRWKAIQCSRFLVTIDKSAGGSALLEEAFRRYRHHLSRSGTDDPLELVDLWADFYLVSGQAEKGVKKIIESANYDPTRWLVAAIASGEIGDASQRDRCCREAEAHFKNGAMPDPCRYRPY